MRHGGQFLQDMRNRLKKSASVCRGLLVAGCNIETVSKPNQDLTQPGPNVFFSFEDNMSEQHRTPIGPEFYIILSGHLRYSKHINTSIISSYP